jgi:hypothetical protein
VNFGTVIDSTKTAAGEAGSGRTGDKWSVVVLGLPVGSPPRLFEPVTGASEYRIARFRRR